MVAASGLAAGATMADVLVSLRCRQCGRAPLRAALVEDPAGDAPGRMGAASGWRVLLMDGAREKGDGTEVEALTQSS